MERVGDIRAFVAVAEARSFAQAARRLHLTPAQMSKLVARLEERLRARLLNRTTRDVSLTDTGRAYLERARVLLDEYDALESAVRESKGPSGLIKMSVPIAFGVGELQPALLDFAKVYPDVGLEIAFTDRLVNLVEDGLDVAIRVAQLGDSSLVARKLAPVRIVTSASPEYLARHGEPKEPAELANHEVIIALNLQDPTLWSFGPAGRPCSVRVHGRVRLANAYSCAAAGCAGLGIARTPA